MPSVPDGTAHIDNDHADRAFPQLSWRAMGSQCLSGRLRGLHRARRPGGGPVWRAAGIDGPAGVAFGAAGMAAAYFTNYCSATCPASHVLKWDHPYVIDGPKI